MRDTAFEKALRSLVEWRPQDAEWPALARGRSRTQHEPIGVDRDVILPAVRGSRTEVALLKRLGDEPGSVGTYGQARARGVAS